MSSTNTSGSTAADAIEQHLSNNSGPHSVMEIANATGYSTSHVRQTAKAMANAGIINGRKNRQKPIIGYDINGNLVVPGSNKAKLRRLIRRYGSTVPSNLGSMSVEKLQDELDNIANGKAVIEHKLEFEKP